MPETTNPNVNESARNSNPSAGHQFGGPQPARPTLDADDMSEKHASGDSREDLHTTGQQSDSSGRNLDPNSVQLNTARGEEPKKKETGAPEDEGPRRTPSEWEVPGQDEHPGVEMPGRDQYETEKPERQYV